MAFDLSWETIVPLNWLLKASYWQLTRSLYSPSYPELHFSNVHQLLLLPPQHADDDVDGHDYSKRYDEKRAGASADQERLSQQRLRHVVIVIRQQNVLELYVLIPLRMKNVDHNWNELNGEVILENL